MYIPFILDSTVLSDSDKCWIKMTPINPYFLCSFSIIQLSSFLVILSGTNAIIYKALNKNRLAFIETELNEKRRKQSRHVMRTLNIMVIVFVILVYPREILYLMYKLNIQINRFNGGIRFTFKIMYVDSWLQLLRASNSCANIFIYAYRHKPYKKRIRKIFKRFRYWTM